MTYGSIVVGTDGSATAERAVAEAAALAAADGARLVVVVAFTPGESAVTGVEIEEVPAEIRHVLTDRVQAEELGARGREVGRAAGVGQVVVQAIAGDPAEAILEAAKDFDAGLVVVGSRGLSGHAHLLLGSVAGSVAHHAPCDVLVAHTTR